MEQRTFLVLTPSTGIGDAVVGRLRGRGDVVAGLDAQVDATDIAAVAAALDGVGPVDVVVLAWFEPGAIVARPIVEFDEGEWDDACERMIRASFVLLQRAQALVRDGGRVVVVLPTVAATGVAGLVPLCTAVESVRVMAKAVARRWGARGVTVNTIEVELGPFVLGASAAEGTDVVPHVPVLGQPALAEREPVDDVVGLIDLLAAPAADGLTGALLVADRGTVLQP